MILDVYLKEIRSVLELAVPAWHSGLTKKQSADTERVQRVSVSIILTDCKTGLCEYSYNMALVILDIEPLEVRREQLCKTFAKKTLKTRHASMFKQSDNQPFTRNKPGFFHPNWNTKRFFNSLCLNFIKRAVRGGPHKDIFIPASTHDMTRSNNVLLKEYTCNTKRFYNSPLVSLSRLYNQNLKK